MEPHGTALGRLAFCVASMLTLRPHRAASVRFIGEGASPVGQELPGALTTAKVAADTSSPWWRALAAGP